MKTILILISFFLLDIHLNAQTATIMDEKILWIPAKPETNRFTISKGEVQKIAFVTSEIGTIESYNLSFKMGDIFYTKDMDDNIVPSKAKELFVNSGAGTIMYLDVKIKDQKSGIIVQNRYEYLLTFE